MVSIDIDTRKFLADMDLTEQELELAETVMYRNLVLDVFASILAKSPVDTGAYRASWAIGINRAPSDADQTSKYAGMDKNSREQNARIAENDAKRRSMKRADAIRPSTQVFISNHVPYAEALEKGHSKRASDGIVGPVLGRAEQIFKEAARKAGFK